MIQKSSSLKIKNIIIIIKKTIEHIFQMQNINQKNFLVK